MAIRSEIISYLFKFYKAKAWLIIISVFCLSSCYLTVEIIFAFSSIIEKESTGTFNAYFNNYGYVMSSDKGIIFRNGNLDSNNPIDEKVMDAFTSQVKGNFTVIQNNSDLRKKRPAYVCIPAVRNKQELLKFCGHNNVKFLSSYYMPDDAARYSALMYNLKDHGNRFNFFSFQNQISATVLGVELSSEIGLLSKLIFGSAALFTLYVTLLYFRERKTEYAIFIIQGYIDLNLKVTFIDCFFQNIIAFILSIAIVVPCIHFYTATNIDFYAACSGIAYILPYFPVIVIVQMLILLNQSINYAASFK